MSLSDRKQQDLLKKVREIEEILVKKFKAPKDGTFGAKIKSVQEKIENQFFVNSVWSMVQIRNAVIHPGDFEVTLKEYNLFRSNYDYVKSVLPNTTLKKPAKKAVKKPVKRATKKPANQTRKKPTATATKKAAGSSSSKKKR